EGCSTIIAGSACSRSANSTRYRNNNRPSAIVLPKLLFEAGIRQKPPRRGHFVLTDQNAAREYPNGAFQHAHVLIDDQMLDTRAAEQRLDRRDQDRIVGPHQFPQGSAPPPLSSTCSAGDPACRPCRKPIAQFRAAQLRRTCMGQRRPAIVGAGPAFQVYAMLYRRLGRTNLRISEIGLGCAS